MATESKRKANAKYDREHTTGVFLKLNKETDKDILEKLSSVPNRQGYIKDLIREDIGSVPVPYLNRKGRYPHLDTGFIMLRT